MASSRALALLAAAILLSHLPLLRAGYVQDDHVAVEGNAVAARGSIAEIASGSYWQGAHGGTGSLYRPVTVGSYALERTLAGGARAPVSHAVNLALHLGVCWVLYLLALRIGIGAPAALAGALLFAVCPSKSEAVANVVGRAEILAALFTLIAVRWFLDTGRWDAIEPSPSAGRARLAAWGCAGAVLLACTSKETGFVVVPLLLLVEMLRPRPGGRAARVDRLGALAPSLLAFEIAVVARTAALEAFFPRQSVPVMDNPLVGLHGAAYLASALALVVRYARILLVPFRLANDYSGASIPLEPTLAAWRPIVGALLLAGLGVAAVRGLRSTASITARRISLGAAIVLLPYLLVSNLIVPIGAIMAERFLYLPVAGLCLMLAVAIDRAGARERRAAYAVAALLGVAMFARALDWRDDATIFAATFRNNPESARAALWLGLVAADRGADAEATRRFGDAVRLWPPYAPPRVERGLLEAKRGRADAALADFREAARLDPGWEAPRHDLAVLLHRRGDLAGALNASRHAVLLDPESARAWAELGHLRFALGQRREAAEAYRRAIALGRTDLAGRLRETEGR